MSDVIAEVRGSAGFITLNRPQALNALSLSMIRALAAALLEWRDDDRVERVAVRGMGREGPFGAFCAGGDIRFFHQAVLAGDPRLEDFFTEEYTLNHLVHGYPKPYVVFLDGIVMGGGMGISAHGGDTSLRIVTERTRMAMPETNIGLFPDVGGGWFLARCPGRIGEYLALTGQAIGWADALAARLADGVLAASELPAVWDSLADAQAFEALCERLRQATPAQGLELASRRTEIDRFFGLGSVGEIVAALEAEGSAWAAHTAALLRQRSPLMLHVTLEHLRRARHLTLAQDLRMERDMIRHCFRLRPGTASETFEGIRALAIDKDHAPKWNPARIEDVTTEMVRAFFDSPWPAHAHPLRGLA
ncbi:enoyl-CoA hydratase/isomerase family protein [Ramlibacter alkalitolerans]|jgi:enoyl-CoA hydratase|uniref:Enoyl-CoA hydratase/isomerase family protein n=1 Tax=Ramlibacter alkalitolerans TaxID=2039631 RepID=A0ABS1JL47_9BURK|nr:enoyl-CoA hydratase/isomerase family protein [Ramlibacter alkalitolerans]MBL0424948.1 enoyl-CoA hydratase/isomerase family protein [Ramlibacter alkalitolerans]